LEVKGDEAMRRGIEETSGGLVSSGVECKV
jgi:hypothetical protein